MRIIAKLSCKTGVYASHFSVVALCGLVTYVNVRSLHRTRNALNCSHLRRFSGCNGHTKIGLWQPSVTYVNVRSFRGTRYASSCSHLRRFSGCDGRHINLSNNSAFRSCGTVVAGQVTSIRANLLRFGKKNRKKRIKI